MARAGAEIVQPVSEVGVRGGCQCGGGAAEEMGGEVSARSFAVSPREGDDEDFGQGEGGRGPASGGSHVVDVDEKTGLPRTDAGAVNFVQ